MCRSIFQALRFPHSGFSKLFPPTLFVIRTQQTLFLFKGEHFHRSRTGQWQECRGSCHWKRMDSLGEERPGVPSRMQSCCSQEPLLGPGSPAGTLSQGWAPVGVETWPGAMWHTGWLGMCKVGRSLLWELPPLPTAPSLGHPQTAARGVTSVSPGGPHSPDCPPLLRTGIACPVSLILRRQTEAQGGHGFAESHTPGRS